MVTSDERARLLGIPCPWCGSAPGEVCVLPQARASAAEGGRRRGALPGPSTLEAGCHDARWRAATGHGAVVRVEVLADVVGRDVRARVLVTAGAGDRPW